MIFRGVIACGGNGTRFAKSVGVTAPYPKHLEQIHGLSVLYHAIQGMRGNIGIDRFTITLNPALRGPYLDHLKDIQSEESGIELTYAFGEPDTETGLFSIIKNGFERGVYNLQGKQVPIGNELVTIALGDSVITVGDSFRLQKDLDNMLPWLMRNQSFAIFRDQERGGLIYWFSRLSELGDGSPTYRRGGSDYDLRWWNCNSREELLVAEEEMRSSRKEVA